MHDSWVLPTSTFIHLVASERIDHRSMHAGSIQEPSNAAICHEILALGGLESRGLSPEKTLTACPGAVGVKVTLIKPKELFCAKLV